MANTARTHFDDDIARVEVLVEHANALESSHREERLYNDIRCSAIAMSVGAMDAYLCDKYVDCLTVVLQNYSRGAWNSDLPPDYANKKLPVGFILDTSRQVRPLWGIRMAVRKLMERENVLSLSKINEMFNPILPDGQKLWADFIPALLSLGRKTLTGPKNASEIGTLSGTAKTQATKKAISSVQLRIKSIAQIRHDWIHNCSRPKNAVKSYTHGEAAGRIRDIRDVVVALDDHIEYYRKA
jgi:hypothetical protein